MGAPIRHCPKHNLDFRGRCPKCHPRRTHSRPAARRQSGLVLERLVKIEPRPVVEHMITTSTFVRRWLERDGIRDDELSADEYCRLFRRASAAADRWNRLFGRAGRGPLNSQVASCLESTR